MRFRYLAIPSGTLAASPASGPLLVLAARGWRDGAGAASVIISPMERGAWGTKSRINCISICGHAARSISKCLVNKHTCCGLGGHSLRQRIKRPFFPQRRDVFVWPIATLVLGRTRRCPDLEIAFFCGIGGVAPPL